MLNSAPDYAVETVDLAKTYPGRNGRPAVHALKGMSLRCRGGVLRPAGAERRRQIDADQHPRRTGRAPALAPRIWGYDIEKEMSGAPGDRRGAAGAQLRSFLRRRANCSNCRPASTACRRGSGAPTRFWAAVGLTWQAEAYARSLSGGMRRRLQWRRRWCTPPVLVLDEPSAGVDVELRRHLWPTFANSTAPTTIPLTTHYLEEAQALCDRIAIINHGRMIACDTTEALLRRIDSKTMTVTLREPVAAIPPTLLSRFHMQPSASNRLIIQYAPSKSVAATSSPQSPIAGSP